MNRLLIYVHYNKYNELSGHVFFQISKISQLFEKIIFISNSFLDESYQNALKNEYNVSTIILRENIGYDFAGWRDGIQLLERSEFLNFDSVTLMNDTCFGPLWDLEKYYIEFESDEFVDFWGMTNHSEINNGIKIIPEHLQSYFMVFHKSVISSQIFISFFENVKNFNNVQDVIDNYEVQFTNILKSHGFTYKSVLNTLTIHNNNNKLNFSLDHPKILIDYNVPFIKVKLFELHQYIAPAIMEYINVKTKYPVSLIIDHLSQIYYPDSPYKLSRKYIKEKQLPLQLKDKIILHIHIDNVDASDILMNELSKNIFSFDILFTVDDENMKSILSKNIFKYKINAEILVLEKNTFGLQPLFQVKEILRKYDYIGYLNTYVFPTEDHFTGYTWLIELIQMMISQANSIISTLINEKQVGIIIPDIPTVFRYRKLIDADMEQELVFELTQLWNELGMKKNIEFSEFDTFVMSYGGSFWCSKQMFEKLSELPISQLISKNYSFNNKIKSIIERLPIYIAWDNDLDFRIVKNPKEITPFIDNKVLNKKLEYREVIVTKEVEVIKEIEVIKEVDKPVYPDFFIDMSGVDSLTAFKYIILVPWYATKFILKWNLIRIQRKLRGN
ncbi:rhamnan synthesis F family protein [Streptococcus rifensis]